MRAFDLAAAAAGLALLAPVLLAVAILVKATSPGPVLHRGLRVSRGGRTFRLFKFRTMVANAERSGPRLTAAADPRITRVGAFLRRSKLDELPQLVNVLRGEMALVGPRPEDPRYVAQYTPEQRRVLAVRPGITSPASLVYRDEASLLVGEEWERYYLDEVLPHKLSLELAYLQRRNWASDVGLIIRTVAAIVLPAKLGFGAGRPAPPRSASGGRPG